MNGILAYALCGCMLAGVLAPRSPVSANALPARAPSKNELIKRCMQKSMSEHRELQYNDAARECAAQVRLQSTAAGPTTAAKPQVESTS